MLSQDLKQTTMALPTAAPLPPGLAGGGAAPPGGMMPPPPGGPSAPNLGGPTAGQSNPGNIAAATLKIRNAVKILEEALPQIPMESPLHEKVLSGIKGLLGAMPDENPDMAGPQQVNLLQMLRQASQSAPQQMLARLGGGGGAPQTPAMPAPAGAM